MVPTRRTLAVLTILLAWSAAAAAERRPVEGRWEFPEALESRPIPHPARHFVPVGRPVAARFVVDARDAGPFAAAAVRYDIPDILSPRRDPKLMEGLAGEGFWLEAPEAGTHALAAVIDAPDGSYRLAYEVRVVFVDGPAPIPPPEKYPGEPVHHEAQPGPVDANGEKGLTGAPAPPGLAHVYGLAATYVFPAEDRRYMLRGLKLELWDATTLLGTVYTSDATGEGNCGLDRQDYIDTTTNTYYHVSDSGSFDFGNIAVGAGKMMWIKEIFEFYAGSIGGTVPGVHRATATDSDDADAVITKWWSLGTVTSGQEKWVGLYNSTYTLSSANGECTDEAMHAMFDVARQYRFFRDCTGFYISHTPVRIHLSSADSPHSHGDDFHLTAWDNGYLTYHYTDSVRHEYTHAMHWRMRGGSMPPRAPGDTNHGNCGNSDSADALLEGYARFVPPAMYRDGVYHWTAASTQNMSIASNLCVDPIPDDRHEWAVGPGMWQGWDNAGGGNAFLNCITDSLASRDPDYVEPTFDGWVVDCSYDQPLWAGFFNNSINYDDTSPDNPASVSVSPNRRWTYDTTPTWSWSTPWDDLSGIDGYGIWQTTTHGTPSAIKDIEEVTSYTPSPLADGNNYYFSIRSVDNAANWAVGYAYQGPIGVDTVQPGAVTGLTSASHTPGVWSQDLSLDMTWTAAVDARSGVDGYGLYTTTGVSPPGTTKDIEEITAYTDTLSSSAAGWYFNIRTVDNAGNWDLDYVSAGPYYVDDVLPGSATAFMSTSHVPGTWSNDTTIDFTWTAAADAHSGIDGYGLWWNIAAGMPGPTKDIEEVTSHVQSASSSASGYYLSLRAVDHAGNWQSDFASAGPYYVDAIAPGPATGLGSATNPVNSCHTDDPWFSATWTAAADAHSGLAGYSYVISTNSPKVPDDTLELAASATALSRTVTYSSAPYYFNLRAFDLAGNPASTVTHGPFHIDRTPAAVTGLMADHVPGDPDAVALSWSTVKAAEYRVDRAVAPWFPAFDSFVATDLIWTDPAPPSVTVVYYLVKGVNACGFVGG